MEQYKQEFIQFMVDSDVLKFGEFTLKKRKKISVLYERRGICDGSPVEETRRVLCKSNPR